MSEPDFADSLLAAGRREGPRNAEAARARVLSAIAASTSSIAPVAGSTSTAAGATARSLSLVRWIGLCVFAAAVARVDDRWQTPEDTRPQSAAITRAAAAPAKANPTAASVDAPVVAVATPHAAPTQVPVVRTPSKPSVSLLPALADEVAAVDAARRALSGGDAARSIVLLDRYLHDYPRARLFPEATVVRIEALLALGDRASATRLGKAFLARSPSSAYASRVRSMIGEN